MQRSMKESGVRSGVRCVGSVKRRGDWPRMRQPTSPDRVALPPGGAGRKAQDDSDHDRKAHRRRRKDDRAQGGIPGDPHRPAVELRREGAPEKLGDAVASALGGKHVGRTDPGGNQRPNAAGQDADQHPSAPADGKGSDSLASSRCTCSPGNARRNAPATLASHHRTRCGPRSRQRA